MMVNIGAATVLRRQPICGRAPSVSLGESDRVPGSVAANHLLRGRRVAGLAARVPRRVPVLAIVVLFLAPWCMFLKRTSAGIAAETVVE